MTTVRITPFRDKHYLEILDIFKEYAYEFSKEDLHLIRKDLLTYLLHFPSKKTDLLIITLLSENETAGAIICRPEPSSNRYYQIDWLAIKKDLQNNGYGAKLLRHSLKKIKEMGYKHVYLKTSNVRYNEKANKFYKKLGFKKIGKLSRYYSPLAKSRDIDDCIIYSKDL